MLPSLQSPPLRVGKFAWRQGGSAFNHAPPHSALHTPLTPVTVPFPLPSLPCTCWTLVKRRRQSRPWQAGGCMTCFQATGRRKGVKTIECPLPHCALTHTLLCTTVPPSPAMNDVVRQMRDVVLKLKLSAVRLASILQRSLPLTLPPLPLHQTEAQQKNQEMIADLTTCVKELREETASLRTELARLRLSSAAPNTNTNTTTGGSHNRLSPAPPDTPPPPTPPPTSASAIYPPPPPPPPPPPLPLSSPPPLQAPTELGQGQAEPVARKRGITVTAFRVRSHKSRRHRSKSKRRTKN